HLAAPRRRRGDPGAHADRHARQGPVGRRKDRKDPGHCLLPPGKGGGPMSEKPDKEPQDPNAPVTLLLTPVRLDYTVVAGHYLSQYLRGFAEKRILGARCEGCNKVLLPPRGAC